MKLLKCAYVKQAIHQGFHICKNQAKCNWLVLRLSSYSWLDKDSDSHSYSLYASSHPKHTFNYISISQFLRLKRLCSDDDDISNNKCIEMRSSFINRQYPAAIVDRAMHKAFSIYCTTALTQKTRAANDRIPFTITFHSVNHSIKPIVNSNFNLLN